MGKIRCFLGFFAILFVAVFAGNSAFAAGYDCPTYKKYTSCTANYYMSGGQVAGNSCKPCGANSTSSGGTASTCTCNTGYSSNGTASGSSTSTSGCSLIKVTCSAGTYLPASKTACATCPAGSYCPGGAFNYSSSNQGINSCSSDYPNSDAGSSAKTQCYKMATKTGSQLDPAMPTGCAARNLTACTPGTCQYRDYDGGTDGTCTPTNCTKTQTCTSASANYYLDSGSAKACPTTYPYSDGGNINSSYCYKNATKTGSQVNGSVPSGCASVTSWNSCTPGTCEYRDYNGATDGTCTPKDCTKTVAAVTAKSGYYDNGTTCPACSSVGDGSYTLSAAGNDGGSSKCYKNCTRACTQQSCPANATCTHGSQTTSGTQYYGGSCSAAASTCSLSFTCNAGYVKNSAGTACEPATYTITYKNGGGTGSDQTQTVTYKSMFTTKPANTFTRPGYNFTSWGGNYPNPNSSYTYNTTGNTTLTAQWSACASNPTGAGTCNCGPTQYPNGSGCSNCSVSCSGVSGFTLGTYNVCNSQNNSICYRNCTTSDVANSATVSGTVTKGGTSTCKATMCADGYYVSGSGCKICPANSGVCGESGDPDGFTCADGYHKSADGLSCEPDEYTITLKKNGGSGTVNGSTGTNDAVQTCKHGEMCTLPNGAGLTRNGYAFTGWGTSAGCTSGIYQETFTSAANRYACWSQQTTQCQAGKYYNGTTHVECPAGMFCPGTGSANIGTAGCGTDCPGAGTSPTGSTSNTACYITCSGGSVTGGTRAPVDETPNYNGSSYPACTYTATCNAGYVAKNQGTANATCEKCVDGVNCPGGTDDTEPEECPAGSYCEEGIVKACPSGGTSAAGAGDITDCYKTCAPTLDIDNGTATSNGNAYYTGSAYPACTYTAVCDENYTAQNSPSANPECVWADPDACPAGSYCPEDGSGPIECPDGGTSDIGATSATQCYKVCSDKSIAGGMANADKDKVNWTGSAYPTCTFTADCDAGYIASGNGTAGAACTPCEDGKYCPGGSDESEPEDCPSGSYCEGGKEPQKCPDGGTSAVGSSALTDCYKTCPASITIENGTTTSTGPAYHNGTSGYKECTYNATCDENYSATGNGTATPECVFSDQSKCPADHYCPGDGTVQECPDGGKSDAGAASPTQCYKVFNPYDGFENGVASAKCNYQTSSQTYDRCTIQKVESCDAGYWYAQQNAFLCSGTTSGFYSPDGAVEQVACPTNPTGGAVESTEYADSYTDCYMACDLSKDDVANSTSVAAKENTVNGISADEYAACSYAITCETGYNITNNNSANPSCDAKTYTVTLNKNGGSGNVAASIKCTFDSGSCTLPATTGLTRDGYTTGNRWCTNAAGTGSCYYAGEETTVNISADGSDIELYAMWTPNVYTINLNHQSADTDGAPETVYLKYATGWFSNDTATTPVSKLTTAPTKTGYEFAGYYSETSGGIQIVSANGSFQMSENALTFTTTEPSTIYARWSVGTTHCDAGTYYSGTGTQCNTCDANHYCEGGNFATDGGAPEGMTACPDNGVSTSGAQSVTQCYKTKLAYAATHGDGTQTCDYDEDTKAYTANCRDKVINVCDEGYWLEDAENENPDCAAVGNGYYSGEDITTRTQCPNGGNTDTTTATMVQQCFKTGLTYEAVYGSGTQRCFYSSGDGASAVYQRDCDTKVINSCRGGYWLESPDDTDCVAVTQNYYSASGDTERHACPANGKTKGETSDNILLCYKDGLPYTEAEHGTGEYLCYYTSGDGADAVYASGCEAPTMTSCDAGYYYDHLVLPDDCMAAGTGYYSPAVDTARYQCPQYPDGTTATTTSASVTECYRVDMMCQIENGVGEQTCNYDDADKNYTADCQTCYVTQCDEGFSQVGNTCIDCPAGSVCTDGEEHTCASLTDGLYPNSDSGTEDVAMCWRECTLDENAATMVGRDYYQSTDTCEIKRCVAGFTLDNGVCAECPAGSFCDGETDPENPGDDVKSCADLGNGEWSLSLSGAKDESGCYQKCEADEVINGTAIPVSDKAFYPNECVYEGQSTTGNPCEIVDGVCIETSCNAGYEMKDGVCEKCNRDFAISYKDGGACLVAECVLGYHPNGDQCEPDVQECTVPNAISAERTWDKQKQAFGSCIIKECEYGYHLSSNACVPDVQPCEVENGSGYKEWDTAKNGWGECIATKCNPGYTNDPSETNEHTKQCGECKNRYSVLGKLAASSYVQGCEIASCMYQGELYNLEYNECVPICPMTEYEDETGTMIWDDSRKKCVRTCKDGYTMW